MDANITNDVLYHAGNRDTKQKQPYRVLLQLLQRIDSKGADPVDRQPGSIEDAPVPEQTFGHPVENLLIYPACDAAGQENQKQESRI